MYRGKRIALVIPVYNDAQYIIPTLDRVPGLVDHIYLVDDASGDGTMTRVRERAATDNRVHALEHAKPRGAGAAVVTGYKRALADDLDVVVTTTVHDPLALEQICDWLDPLINGAADYAKGNRFLRRRYVFDGVPLRLSPSRVVANAVITLLTKVASGYYKISDVANRCTAITRDALEVIDWDQIWHGRGYPMDFLIRLNAHGFRVKDVAYRTNDGTGNLLRIKNLSYALHAVPMLLRGFFWRLWTKYILWNFHPLVFFYFAGMALCGAGGLLALELVRERTIEGDVGELRTVLDALFLIMGTQFLLFAMTMDMQESLDLLPMDRRMGDRLPRDSDLR